MSVDLQAALRDAVADAPFDPCDCETLVAAGERRVRRQVARRAGISALAVVAVVLTSLALGSDRWNPPDREPSPADPVQLDLDAAEAVDLDVLATARTTLREPFDDLSYERLEGVTSDGLVLQSRYSYQEQSLRVGLLDPRTGTTDWLPEPPMPAKQVAELSETRLSLVRWGNPTAHLLSFDRAARTWDRVSLELPRSIEMHAPPQLAVGPDGRLYLGHTLEGDQEMRWWSYALPAGGEPRPEPDLTGLAVAWAGDLRATADPAGRVRLTGPSGERELADERPTDCPASADPVKAALAPMIALAGERPVVTYLCGSDHGLLTVVYDTHAGASLQIPGVLVRAAAEGEVLLTGWGRRPSVYLLDLEGPALRRLGAVGLSEQMDVGAGLVLWNQLGPLDDRRTSDTVWKVADVE